MSTYTFTFYGPSPVQSVMDNPSFAQSYGGFLTREELDARFQAATGFIVTMSFLPGDRRRSETSFPSKLVEYTRYGKPIFIWGPEHCSAVRWARETGAAACFTSPDPAAFAEALAQLSQDQDKMNSLGQAASRAYEKTFHPDLLQKIFSDTLQEAAQSRGKRP